MSNHAALPAEQRLHTGVSLEGRRHDDNLTADSSGSQEASGPPPSYAITDALGHFDSDMKHKSTEVEGNTVLADLPAQVPFDDPIGGPPPRPARRTLPPQPREQQDSLSSPMAVLHQERQTNGTREADVHTAAQTPQQQSPDVQHRRPDLPHSPRSTPDTRRKLRKISELGEVDPYGNQFHEESPFEAGRRAQRVVDREGTMPSSSLQQAYANGRFPSIKPGEIMPINTIRPIHSPPNFFPPLEAPPFPPIVHTPIRPAHFPPNLHPPPPAPELARAPSHHQTAPLDAPHLPTSHSHVPSPSPSQPIHPPPNPNPAYSYSQRPPEPLRSLSQRNVPHPPPPQPLRSNSHQGVLHPQSEFPDARPSRRHTYNARDGVPPGLAPNGRYPVPQPLPPSPHRQQPPPHHHLVPQPPLSQTQRQHHPPPPHSALRDPHRHSLSVPPPSRGPPNPSIPSPVHPSQNVSTPQALGIVHSPPTPSDAPRTEPSRPPRSTPKPVMPQLLAPLAAQEYNIERNGSGQLHRSASSAAITGEKGGFLSKTKSILRKRTSSSGIKTHTDGAISFAPTMPNLVEENGMDSGKLGKRLSKKK